ncbi:DNA cytosine methyltransferase, partial [Escherichia coli O8:H10]
LKPWRTAAECIDWSIPAPSIFDCKKALAENTLKRIARGIQRFVIDSASPFIVKCNHTTTKGKYDCFRGQALAEPLQTITKTHGYAIATPVMAPLFAGTGGSTFQMKPRPVDKPFFTLLTQNRTNVIAPVLAPLIARQFGASVGHRADEPSATVTAGGGGKSQLVCPTLIQMGYGERPGQAPRVLQMNNPLGTVTAGGNKFAMVAANLVKHFGGNYQGAGVALDEPAHTVTTTDHHGLVTSHLVKLRGTCRDGQPIDQPMPTITAGGLHVGEVKTTLAVEVYDQQLADQTLAFLREYCGADCDGLVTISGVVYRIVDIGMRMLQPSELYAAQGFPEWYIIDRDYMGNRYA